VVARPTWSANYKGIEYGWTSNHAWAIASYATVITLGSGQVASLICGALIGEGPFVGGVCSAPVEMIVNSLVRGHARVTNHGIWVAFYPNWGDWYTTEGAY
jgi:hypothetical protein